MNVINEALRAAEQRAQKAEAEVARLREVLERIERAPAWGYPVEWRTTPAEVRQLARSALQQGGNQ